MIFICSHSPEVFMEKGWCGLRRLGWSKALGKDGENLSLVATSPSLLHTPHTTAAMQAIFS